jgi:hypothetical protein
MPFIRYSEHDVRRLLARAIPLRWPHERLLFVTGCRAERTLGEESPPNESERGGWRYYDHHSADRRGYLAATRARLIYQDCTTASSVIMGVSVLLGIAAMAMLLFGNDLMGWLVTGGIALLLWMLGRVVEAVTAGNVDVQLEDVVRLDSGTQRMVAVGRRDTVLSLHIHDPSDFRMVAALVSGLGNTA